MEVVRAEARAQGVVASANTYMAKDVRDYVSVPARQPQGKCNTS